MITLDVRDGELVVSWQNPGAAEAPPPEVVEAAVLAPIDMANNSVSVRVGLIATTSLKPETVAELAAALAQRLSQRYPDVSWDVQHVRDRLVTPPVNLT